VKVLLYHRLNIGDLILASPALQAFKADHPQARIGLVTNDFVAPVARLMPHVDECWSYAKLGRDAPAEWRVLASLRAFGADATIGLSPSPDRKLAFRVMLFPGGVGFGDGAFFRFAYRGKCLPAVGSGHVAATLGRLFGYADERALPDCRLEIPRIADGRLAALLFVDARKPSNRPAAPQLLAVIEGLLAESGGEIAIAGVPAESTHASHQGNAALAGELRGALAGRPRCVFPEVRGIEDIIGLVARADSVVCPDGGVMHIAAAAGCPVVGLFGDVSPGVWGPRARRSVALQAGTRRVPDIAPERIVEAWRGVRG